MTTPPARIAATAGAGSPDPADSLVQENPGPASPLPASPRTLRPRRRLPVWMIARGAKGPWELADRVLRLLAFALVAALVGYMSWVLLKHFWRELESIKRHYWSVLGIGSPP